MNTYLVKFLGISIVGLPQSTQFELKVQAWSEEEARESIHHWFTVQSDIKVQLVSYYSEQDHDELELRMEQGI